MNLVMILFLIILIKKKPSRQIHHNKKNSVKRKKMKISSFEKIQDDFLLDMLNKELYTTKSPHILVTRTFCHIKQNSIILHHPVVENENSRSRNISYKIKYVGKKIELHQKKKYINLRPGSSSNNVVFILIDNREMIHIPGVAVNQ